MLGVVAGGIGIAAGSAHVAGGVAIPGADPTGRNDSSAALSAYVVAQCRASVHVSTAEPWMLPQNVDVDLAGGVYRMDAPLSINGSAPCSGTLRIHDGTLLAGPGLAAYAATNESFLVTVLDYWTGLGVSLDRISFASNFTGGGVRVDAAHHVHVTDSSFVNFATFGVWGSSFLGMGHDLVVDRSLFTECTMSMDQCADISGKHATAIQIEFPDSHFRNDIITCGRAGVVNRGGANFFSGFHIWPSCNHEATGDNLTVGFIDESGTAQISGMYFDNCRMIIAGGGRGTTLTNSYFNGHATLQLDPPTKIQPLDPADAQCQ